MPRHYKISPSQLYRTIECPGSLRLAHGLVSESSEYATEGTQAHGLAEQMLTGDGVEPPDDEMGRYISDYVRYCESIEHSHRFSVSLVEETMESKKIPDFGGTADFVCFYESGPSHTPTTVSHIVDLKYGKGKRVDVQDNPQMMAYLLLLREGFGVRDEYRATIYQPRIPGEPDSTWAWTNEELDNFQQDILEMIAEENEDVFSVGDWCGWCPAFRTCPHVQEAALAAARSDFSEMVPANNASGQAAAVAKLLQHKPALEKLLRELPAVALDMVLAGHEIPGWKAVEAMGNRTWKHDEETTLKKLAGRKVGKKIATKPKIKSPTQLDNEGYGHEIRGLFYRPELGPKLAKATDKRPAITAEDATAVFLPSVEKERVISIENLME